MPSSDAAPPGTGGRPEKCRESAIHGTGGAPFTVDLAVVGHLARPTAVGAATAASVADRAAGAPTTLGVEPTATSAAVEAPVQVIYRLVVNPLLGTVTIELLGL